MKAPLSTKSIRLISIAEMPEIKAFVEGLELYSEVSETVSYRECQPQNLIKHEPFGKLAGISTFGAGKTKFFQL